MGAGASVDSTSSLCRDLKDLKTKPVDCSDVEDSLEKSLAELGKLRQILQQIDIDKLQEIVHNAEFQSSILEADSASSADLDYATKLLNQIKLKMGERFKSLRKTFLAIDQDNSGFISRQEFKDSCAEWGVMIDDEDCESLDKLYPHQEADSAEDKGINYLEFIAMMTKQVSKCVLFAMCLMHVTYARTGCLFINVSSYEYIIIIYADLNADIGHV